MLLLAGVLLVAASAVGVVGVFRAQDQAVRAVGISQRIAYGQVISESALRMVEVRPGPGIAPVPWDRRAELVGKTATTDLLPGSLVTGDVVVGNVLPAQTEQLVGVAVKPAQLPSTALKPRDRVLLVPSAQTAGAASADWSPVRGTVLVVGDRDNTGLRVVDVAVAAGDGPALATRASTGQVAIVLLPRG